jgi:polyisoprenoid-binding protein YceI
MSIREHSDYPVGQSPEMGLETNSHCDGSAGLNLLRRVSRRAWLAIVFMMVCAGPAPRLLAAPAGHPLNGKAVYAATSPMADWTGTNSQVSGSATWDGDARTVGATVTIDLAGWNSGSGLRDKHTVAMFETDKFPKATFAGTAATGAAGGTNAMFKGTFELHGVRRELEFPGAVLAGKDEIAFKGDFVLRLTDWGIKPPSLLGATVGNEVKVHIDASAASK